jgi:uncharacterized repeat protein (TIGR03833 family)
MTDIPSRDQIKPGTKVGIETKKDQGTGKISLGIVKNILTSSNTHPYGIKVELEDGAVGRVQELFLGTGKIIKKESRENDGEFTTITSETRGPGDLDYEVNAKIIIDPENTVKELDNKSIPKNEDMYTEFKSTFQYDLKEEILRKDGKIKDADIRKKAQNSIKNDIQKEISLAVAAFANNDSGRLFIGVDDDSGVLGLGRDLKECGGTIDKLQLKIVDSLKHFLKDNSFIAKLKFEFVTSDNKQYLVISVPAATKAILVHDSNNEEMYVRIQNRSEKFTTSDFLNHCKDRFTN